MFFYPIGMRHILRFNVRCWLSFKTFLDFHMWTRLFLLQSIVTSKEERREKKKGETERTRLYLVFDHSSMFRLMCTIEKHNYIPHDMNTLNYFLTTPKSIVAIVVFLVLSLVSSLLSLSSSLLFLFVSFSILQGSLKSSDCEIRLRLTIFVYCS
jgi:hypothetical protein